MGGDRVGDGGLNRPLGGASVGMEFGGWEGGLLPLVPTLLCGGWLQRLPEPAPRVVPITSCSVLIFDPELVTTLLRCWITARPLWILPAPLAPLPCFSAPSSLFTRLLVGLWSHSLTLSSSSSTSLSLAWSEEVHGLSSLWRNTSIRLLASGGPLSGSDWCDLFLVLSDWLAAVCEKGSFPLWSVSDLPFNGCVAVEPGEKISLLIRAVE